MRARSSLVGLALFALGSPAFGATWAAGTTPRLGQIFAIDITGEPGWIYGPEDVLGDGAQSFTAAEQALDLRTAYASTNGAQLWTRVYVSSTAAADPTLEVFVFIDADNDATTGGGTNSPTLSAMFTAEHSPGGYEFVLASKGDGTIAGAWKWQAPDYVPVTTTPAQASAEVGTDTDPIRIGAGAHAYIQGRVDLGLAGLTQACDAHLYIRSARDPQVSDLDMTYATTCVPADTNGDKIPDILTGMTCTADVECPQAGVCKTGKCVLSPLCTVDADCPTGDTCGPDGYCVGTTVTGNGEVEGGAFHCDVAPTPKSALAFGLLAGLLGLFQLRRRRG